ncbi:hypothetical protein [Rubrobacter indicoceani]|uniref:hypothetical protein n=1 Tax=Rubrobacter indicoceani TaxID=2051957 RepID=UPI000E5A2FBB|nr:hypothetical protein [Rubrobacter indicoceani]
MRTSGFFRELARGKAPPAAFGLALIGAVLLPLRENRREAPEDNFPLSYYPMFTANRGRHTTVNYLVGADAAGKRKTLPATLAGTGGLNQVRRQINHSIREGRADELCASVARAVAESRAPELSGIRTVSVVRGAYRLERYFAGETKPHRERVVALCNVERSAG